MVRIAYEECHWSRLCCQVREMSTSRFITWELVGNGVSISTCLLFDIVSLISCCSSAVLEPLAGFKKRTPDSLDYGHNGQMSRT